MKYDRVCIGEIIKDKVAALGISTAKFAQMIRLQRQNVQKTIYSKNGIDTDLLIVISEALDYDFFQHYRIKDETNTKDYIKPVRGKLSLEFGDKRADQVFKFEFGENNIEILNR